MFERFWAVLRRWPRHPIDRQYGIETSSRVPRTLLKSGDERADRSSVGYVGSQPSIVRHALDAIPNLAGSTFIDLGCGKGRVLAVATEYPFRSIVGIELARRLARKSEKNLAKVAKGRPDRVKVSIVCGDACRPELPNSGLVILYLYNPFGADLVTILLDHISAELSRFPDLTVFIVYYNPTQFSLVDDHPQFHRYTVERVEFSPEEHGSSPFKSNFDSIAVWQSAGPLMVPPLPGADREIRVTTPDLSAHVF